MCEILYANKCPTPWPRKQATGQSCHFRRPAEVYSPALAEGPCRDKATPAPAQHHPQPTLGPACKARPHQNMRQKCSLPRSATNQQQGRWPRHSQLQTLHVGSLAIPEVTLSGAPQARGPIRLACSATSCATRYACTVWMCCVLARYVPQRMARSQPSDWPATTACKTSTPEQDGMASAHDSGWQTGAARGTRATSIAALPCSVRHASITP